MSRPGIDHGSGGHQSGAVHGAFAVLEEVARVGPGVTAQQISANLGLPRATTYRLLNVLVHEEYLVRLPDLTGFALGRKVAMLVGLLGGGLDDSARKRQTQQTMQWLRARIRGGVHLVSYRSGNLELVDIDPDFPLSDQDRILGDLKISAVGRLLAAERVGTPRAFAVQDGKLIPGYGCFAAAIRDPGGRLIAGLALALPSPRLRDPESLLELVREDCTHLAAVLS